MSILLARGKQAHMCADCEQKSAHASLIWDRGKCGCGRIRDHVPALTILIDPLEYKISLNKVLGFSAELIDCKVSKWRKQQATRRECRQPNTNQRGALPMFLRCCQDRAGQQTFVSQCVIAAAC
jgi:hypothetical protein